MPVAIMVGFSLKLSDFILKNLLIFSQIIFNRTKDRNYDLPLLHKL